MKIYYYADPIVHIGSEYLYTHPNSAEEQAYFENYIKSIESDYNSKFQFGSQAEDLIADIKTNMQVEISVLKIELIAGFGADKLFSSLLSKRIKP